MNKRFPSVVLGLCLLALSQIVRADSVVVFNEIMYHPLPNDPELEWIELHNQMSVNVELSGWTLTGGIEFHFPEGTVVPGGGYLLISASPARLRELTGITNALGPLVGRLANDGDRLQLRNNNQRLMDEVTYGTDGPWPVAPDGSGVSLAKSNEDSASADPRNWITSALVGGTPGKRNFAPAAFEVTRTEALALNNGPWGFSPGEDSSNGDWRQTNFDERTWASGAALFGQANAAAPSGDLQPIPSLFSTGVDNDGMVVVAGSADPHYLLTQSAQGTPPPPAIPATVIVNHPAWAANDGASSWIGAVNPGAVNVAAGVYAYRTSFSLEGFVPTSAIVRVRVGADNRLNSVLLNGVSKGISYVGFTTLSSEFLITNGFTAGNNTLEFITANDDASANPAGFRAVVQGQARKRWQVQTSLPAGSPSYYFRDSFLLEGPPQLSAVQLRALAADGAVFYLNGTEVFRFNMPAGPVLPSTLALSNASQPAILGPLPLPSSHLVTGTNLLAVEVHRGPADKGRILFGAELALTRTNISVPGPVSLAFNEQSGTTNSEFWVELVNYGTVPLDLRGLGLVLQSSVPSQTYPLPETTLAPGAFLRLNQATLGFRADPGDRLFLYGLGGTSVIDAIAAKRAAMGRWPDGTGPWAFSTVSTPGMSNHIEFHETIVINEIMFDPPIGSTAGLSNSPPDQWLELFNRGAQATDLTGWQLSGDVEFAFPAGTRIPAGAYLVVANDLERIRTENPGINIAGPWQTKLRKEGTVELLDAAGNLANRVSYSSGKPWPDHANGGGSSLELRDAWADNSNPQAWAASIESGRTTWTNYTYRGFASNVLGPTQWKEFVLGLLDAGECLIDDLHVIENPSSTAVSMLQNGSFENGLTSWRVLGNHSASRVEVDPENSANHVLHLIATGPTEHLHNHLETTLASGLSVVNGREYQISFRAKWLAGNNRLNTRLYFNRVAKTTALAMPGRQGTPGAPNSTAVPNLGPTFTGLAHQPIVPKPNQAVTVSIEASDPQGMGAVVLWWSTNQVTWKQTPMLAVTPAVSPGFTQFQAAVPGQPTGTLVQFFVQATDSQGSAAVYPVAGINSRALFKVEDAKPLRGALHRLRLLMTAADANRLHAPTNVMSNDRLGSTLVSDDQIAFYDVGVHLQGSERGRNDGSRVGFTVRFNRDQLYRGVQNTLTLDKSGGYSGRGGKHDELLLWHAANHAGGLLGLECDLVECLAPRPQEDGTAMLRMSAFDADYFNAQFPNGADGQLYKLELIYYPLTSASGNVQAPKLPQPDAVINVDIQNRGEDPEIYRWIFLQENHADQDDYSQLIALNKAFSLSGALLESQTSQLMDLDEWMRTLAFKAFTGDGDTFTYGLNHNWQIYFRPDTGKALGLLWDMDFAYAQSVSYASPGGGSPNTAKITRLPNNYRRFASHLLDLANTTMNAAYLQPWATHYAGLVGQNWSGAVSYVQQRAQYLRGTLPLNVAFKITTNGGQDFSTSSNPVSLAGTAPLTVDHFVVNGVRVPVNWVNLTNWNVSLRLTGQTNHLVLQGLDYRGKPVSGASASLNIVQLGAPVLQPVVINEWMAENMGPGGFADALGFADWFELYNPNTVAVSLAGFYLTDTASAPDKWQVPAGTLISPHQFLLVWADNHSELNLPGQLALHAGFQLNKAGDFIGLFGPDGAPQHSVTFGPQLPNVSQGLFPDGNTNAVLSMQQWTPGSPNSVEEPPSPAVREVTFQPDGKVELQISTLPRRTYRIEFKEDLSALAWLPLGQEVLGTGGLVTVTDSIAQRPYRFYRVMLVQ